MVSENEKGETAVTFEVLTQCVPGPKPDTSVWIARSVTTDHVAHGDTENASIERLFSGIDALIRSAAERQGLSPQDWVEANRVCEHHFVDEFARMEREDAVVQMPDIAGPLGLRIALRKATQPKVA